jgi:uncharacterized membrane protein YeaQ/YmgE (transglycosylase-associated protein family)
MTLVPLRHMAPQTAARVEAVARERVAQLKRELPQRAVVAVRNATAAAAAGTAADQISKRLMARGTVPAVVAGLAGAAAARAIVEGGFQVGTNIWQKRDWHDHLMPAMAEGARRGAINGGLTMLAKPLTKAMKDRYGDLGAVKLAAATGAVRGTIGGASNSISDPKTWKDGVAKGAGRVALSTVRSGVQGAASAAVMAKAQPWVHGKLDKYIDFTALGQNWFLGKGGGGNAGDGFFWRLFEKGTSGSGGLTGN